MFGKWKREYYYIANKKRELEKQLQNINSKINEIGFNNLDLKNQLAVKNKKLHDAESKIRELNARIGGLTKEKNKLKTENTELKKILAKRYILKKVKGTGPTKDTKIKMSVKAIKHGNQANKILKEVSENNLMAKSL